MKENTEKDPNDTLDRDNNLEDINKILKAIYEIQKATDNQLQALFTYVNQLQEEQKNLKKQIDSLIKNKSHNQVSYNMSTESNLPNTSLKRATIENLASAAVFVSNNKYNCNLNQGPNKRQKQVTSHDL